MSPQLRTANYPEAARKRLGEAVTNAREADGYKFRPAFAPVAGVSLRALAALELGEPTVGATTLRAVGRALSTWTEDTPRVILEGGPIPSAAAEQRRPRIPTTAELLGMPGTEVMAWHRRLIERRGQAEADRWLSAVIELKSAAAPLAEPGEDPGDNVGRSADTA